MNAALPAAAERAGWIEKIRRLPDQLEHLLDGMTPAELTTHFVPGEWTVAQNIHHVADSHMNSYIRCRLILTEEEPALKPYDQDRWAAIPDARALPVDCSLAIIRGLHTRWVQFFETLTDVDWGRQGFHPEAGLVSLADQARLYANHGEAHISQIRRTLGACYPALPSNQDELVARTDREWARLTRLVGRMTQAQLDAPFDNGWSPKAHVAHITDWGRYLVGHTIGGQPPHVALGLPEAEFTPDDVDSINDRLEQRSRDQSPQQVLAEAQRTYEQVRAAIAGLTWAECNAPNAPDEQDPRPKLERICCDCYEHYLEHWQWLPVV